MKNRFLNVVPKVVQVGAVAIVAAAVLIGLALGYHSFATGAVLQTMLVPVAAALATGIVIAIWLLCLGFVFADARRRGMRAAGWTLVAMLMPNLLGFLLYFVMRRPLGAPCVSCNREIPVDQPFCSWCGSSRAPLPSARTPSGTEPVVGGQA
jgi:Phospholipase_D-nuclease N-terminal